MSHINNKVYSSQKYADDALNKYASEWKIEQLKLKKH